MVVVMVVVVVVEVLFRILLSFGKIWVVVVDASLFLVILEDVIFILLIFFMTPTAVQYLGTIVIVLRNCGRIEGWVKSSIVVVGGVQTPVLRLRPVGAGDELGDRSERVQRLVDSVVALVAQHHLRLI